MKLLKLLAQAAAALGLLAGGMALGIWLHGRAEMAGKTGWEGAPVPLDERGEGPFSYRFTPGETLRYRFNAKVLGSGTEQRLDPMDINMRFDAALSLDTLGVDGDGAGDLELRFDDVHMDGTFMGGPVLLEKTADFTRYATNGATKVDTRRGDSLEKAPQLAFFNTPIKLKVGPNGDVLDARGMAGMEQMLLAGTVLTPVKFPYADIEEEREWVSEIKLPIPGLGVAPTARVLNRMAGYEQRLGRACAVVEQEISSAASNETLFGPETSLGGAVGFTMPKFLLDGNNVLYFDPEDGHLVDSDLYVKFGLRIGRELQGAVQLLGIYGQLLGEVEGGPQAGNLELDTSNSLMDLGVTIDGRLSLDS